ncbi:uncharacterized protein CTHT_0059610 [Thermochaetoides thermophila DSM 1495]|uniref:C2H2-type domain-containing protein n=1 Tax=Chaetomium thermophilum (strain DSM 1495 / CBS 144.50 / IMI 039719) TaxID=759272 RepID=G0SET2_CHATD|nr:hypothetical protein CTHT_0059610 [Thermochaetoides thermophila DSM 1495]EGS17948.1 hypothetical protein CTHT_0059610 [Thermochaetoides thermophila DSM 1495]
MSSNPRRTPVTRADSRGLTLKTNAVLKKGATFHSPTTPSDSPERVFRPPPLPSRSHTNLDDVIDAHRRRVALTIEDIDKVLSGLTTKDDSSPSALKSLRDDSLPLPRVLLHHTLDAYMGKEQPERRIIRPRSPRSSRHHDSDSGLGTSVPSTPEKEAEFKKSVKTSAVTRSATRTAAGASLPGLSARATNRIYEHTLKPLLAKSFFKDFHPLVLECPKKIREKQIVCLRDVEKTLLLVAPERAKTAGLYLDFCQATIRCIQATVEYLSDQEQIRPGDVPYSSGYFLDLIAQIHRYAQQLAEAKEKGDEGDTDLDATDEIKLHGGIHINGRPAELVRVKKNGKMISLATGETIEKLEEEPNPSIGFKRSASQELADEEEIMRSMARRKKNASPEELAPKKCRVPGCGKEFKRPCDLTKHEKTHSRPWKCPVTTCKYHEYGWPTEKEMDRHINDKHADNPPMFECYFKPCPYKSKRESNCKQHMEKAHGWTYIRTKTNGKKSNASVAGNNKTNSSPQNSSTQPTPQLQNIPTPPSEPTPSVASPDDWSRIYGSNLDFPTYVPNDADFTMIPQELTLDLSPIDHSTPFDSPTPLDNPTPSTDAGVDFNSAYQDIPTDFTLFEDIYSAPVQLPTPPPLVNLYKEPIPQLVPFTGADLCHPQPVPELSPVGQGSAMLFTPSSLAEVDEGFDECNDIVMGNAINGGDFILFPNGGARVSKPLFPEPLFATADVPSISAGFSQPSSQDVLNALGMEWSVHDFNNYLRN